MHAAWCSDLGEKPHHDRADHELIHHDRAICLEAPFITHLAIQGDHVHSPTRRRKKAHKKWTKSTWPRGKKEVKN